ncbi:MAG: phage portal protein [Clostridia bacterium]|nr:phage portal protein [Clostridia bacterium]
MNGTKPYTLKIVKGPKASGYSDAGASHVKRALKAFVANSRSAVEDIDMNNMTMRQRGRMLYMASPVAAGAINTQRTKVVGPGLYMRPAIDRQILGLTDEEAERWTARTKAEFSLWAENKYACDVQGMNNLYALQQLALKSMLMSGDTFAVLHHEEPTQLLPYGLRVQLIEADRVSTPSKAGAFGLQTLTEGETKDGNKIHDGVEVNDVGRVVAYHICSHYPAAGILTGKESVEWTPVPAVGAETGLPNVLHVMTPERPEQYRGVTYLAPVIETLLQLRRYTESELVAAIIQSYLTAWITTQTDPTEIPFNEVGDGDVDGAENEKSVEVRSGVSDSENEYEMGPGQVTHLQPGENITFGNPNIPTAGFDAFVRAICRVAGAGLELPYDVLMKEYNSSYSAAKGALEDAWTMLRMVRKWFIDDFCQPLYEVWLAEAVARGRIQAPGFFTDPLLRRAWSGAVWDGPAQIHLDPLKESKANEVAVSHGWKTNAQVTRENYGGDWRENVKQIQAENDFAGPGE